MSIAQWRDTGTGYVSAMVPAELLAALPEKYQQQ